MTYNLQRPLARHLSSFAYRLSGEHPGIIKRRYLFFPDRPRLTTDPLSTRPLLFFTPQARGRRAFGEKSVTNRLRVSFTDCWRDTDRATLGEQRDRYSRVRFSTWTGLAVRRLILTGPRRGVLAASSRTPHHHPWCVVSWKKSFTEPPNKAERKRERERERSLSAIKRKRKKERDKQERKDSGITRREGLPLVPRSLDSYGDLRLANGAFCLANYLSAVFDFRNILCARRIILRPVARCRDDNSRHRSDRSGRARVSIRLF